MRPRTLPGEVWRGTLTIGKDTLLYAIRERRGSIRVCYWGGDNWYVVIEREVMKVVFAALRHEQDQAMRAEARLAEELATNKQLNKSLHGALDAVVDETRARRNYQSKLVALGVALP